MPTRKSRKFAIWSCVAILLAIGLYWSSYYRMVVVLRFVETDGQTLFVKTMPGYRLPWPFSTDISQPPLRQKVDSLYAPAHELDRMIRPQIWATTKSKIDQAVSLEELPNPQ